MALVPNLPYRQKSRRRLVPVTLLSNPEAIVCAAVCNSIA
jgi:hypothetical protein